MYEVGLFIQLFIPWYFTKGPTKQLILAEEALGQSSISFYIVLIIYLLQLHLVLVFESSAQLTWNARPVSRSDTDQCDTCLAIILLLPSCAFQNFTEV